MASIDTPRMAWRCAFVAVGVVFAGEISARPGVFGAAPVLEGREAEHRRKGSVPYWCRPGEGRTASRGPFCGAGHEERLSSQEEPQCFTSRNV
jgi:hypothetical protein